MKRLIALTTFVMVLAVILGTYRHNTLQIEKSQIQQVQIKKQNGQLMLLRQRQLAERKARHSKAKKYMSAALAYYYQTFIEGYPYSGSTPAASTFSVAAPLLYDGSPGDTSTGYVVDSNGTLAPPNGNNGFGEALIDLGPSPPAITYWNYAATTYTSSGANLYSSTNGTTWTIQDNENIGGSTPDSFESGNTNVVARYWLCAYVIDAPEVVSLTDFRLWTNATTYVSGPPSTRRRAQSQVYTVGRADPSGLAWSRDNGISGWYRPSRTERVRGWSAVAAG
jgi:hypothetical protein